MISWIVQFDDFGCCFFEIFLSNVSVQLGQLREDEHKEMHLELLQQKSVVIFKWNTMVPILQYETQTDNTR